MCNLVTKAAAALCFSAVAAYSADLHSAHLPEYPQATQRLVTATASLFDAIEAGETQLAATRDHLGQLTGYRITWYDTGALLGTVDFVGTAHGGRNLVCGYLTFAFDSSGEPRLRDFTSRIVPADIAQSETPEQANRTLLEANCAFGDLASNFALSNRS